MHYHSKLINSLSFSLLHPSMANTSMGREITTKLLMIVDALAAITPHVLIGKYDRGVMNHYRRVVRELARTLKASGITLADFYQALSKSLEKNVEPLIDSNFLRSELEANYSDFV
jgi:hypothetical protein